MKPCVLTGLWKKRETLESKTCGLSLEERLNTPILVAGEGMRKESRKVGVRGGRSPRDRERLEPLWALWRQDLVGG